MLSVTNKFVLLMTSLWTFEGFANITLSKTKKHGNGRPSTTANGGVQEPRGALLENQFPIAPNQPIPPDVPVDRSTSHSDLVARAARAAQIALQGQGVRKGTRQGAKSSQQGQQLL